MLTATTSSIIRKTANGAFYQGLNSAQGKPSLAPYITTFNTSGKNAEFGWFGSIPAVTEFTGRKQYKALNAYTDTITPREWEVSVEFAETTFEDDATGTAAQAAAALVARARDHVNVRATTFLENGIAGTSDTSFDGQFFFDGDHYGVTDAAHDNDLTGTAATGTDPTAAEFETAVGDMLEAMYGFVDDAVQPWYFDISRAGIMVPTEYTKVANVVLGPNGTLGGGAAGAQVFNAESGVTGVTKGIEWFANPHLANADSVYCLVKPGGGTVGPLVLNMRRPWEFKVYDSSNSEQCADERLVRMTAYARYEVGYGAWQDGCVYIFT